MNLQYAVEYAKILAEGIDPHTGELFPETHICNDAETVRVLYTLINAAACSNGNCTGKSSNIGSAWSQAEENQLIAEFQKGVDFADIAHQHGRTRGAIISRLKKLGLLSK